MSRNVIMNASDRRQVKIAERQENQRALQLEGDFRDVLRTPGGRRVFQFILDKLQPDTGMWQPNAAIQFLAAQHDAGTWIKKEIDKADAHALALMLTEKMEQKRRDRAEKDAAAMKAAENRAVTESAADDEGETNG